MLNELGATLGEARSQCTLSSAIRLSANHVCLCFMFGQLLSHRSNREHGREVEKSQARHFLARALARKGIARVSLRLHVQQQGAHRHISFS